MSTTIAGVRFSDTLAALLDHAAASGFRIEKDTRGRTSKGVLLFSPDTDVPPLTVEERGAKFNRAHYENLRRELYRAGCPPLPGDAPDDDDEVAVAVASEAEAMRGMPEGTVPMELMPGVGFARTPQLEAILGNPDVAPRFIADMTEGLTKQAGLGTAEASLIGALVQVTTDWAMMNSHDRIAGHVESLRAELTGTYEQQIADALTMAEEAETRAVQAENACEKAKAEGARTGKMLTEALARADKAEADAKRLEQALAPLRAILSLNPADGA